MEKREGREGGREGREGEKEGREGEKGGRERRKGGRERRERREGEGNWEVEGGGRGEVE